MLAKRGLGHEIGQTVRLAGPVVLANLGMMGMGFVDTVMVGRLGPVALAGVALANAVFFATIVFFAGLLGAVEPIVSQSFGAGRRERCGAVLWSGLWVAAVVSLPLTIAFLDASWLLSRLGAEPAVAAAAGEYLTGRSLGVAAMVMFFAGRCFLNAVGDPRPVLLITLAANVVNALADWALIYGGLGLPALGVAGAGYATAISRWFMLGGVVLCLASSRYRELGVRPRWPELGVTGRLLRTGLPIGGQLLAEVGVFASSAVLVAWLGSVALSSHQIAMNLASLTFMVPMGVGVAASVRVGHAIGRGEPEAARRAGAVALALGVGFMAVAGVVFATIPGLLVRVYTEQPEVVATAASLLLLAAAFQVFDGAQAIAGGCLRGAGDTRTPLVANVVAHWGLGLPLGVFLTFEAEMGPIGMWFGFTASLALVAVWLCWRFARSRARVVRSLVE